MGKKTEITRHFVATVYVIHDNKVLLTFHKKIKKWLPPGGHIDENELPDEAALREVKEETGLDVEIISDKEPRLSNIATPLHRPEFVQMEDVDGHQHIDLLYLAVPKTHDLKISSESEDVRWFSLHEMKENVPSEIRHHANKMIKKLAKE
ncbi:MAG: NUDIX domain-containing protein [Candidatus Aenigmatarchaeota archaeon]